MRIRPGGLSPVRLTPKTGTGPRRTRIDVLPAPTFKARRRSIDLISQPLDLSQIQLSRHAAVPHLYQLRPAVYATGLRRISLRLSPPQANQKPGWHATTLLAILA